MPFVQRRLSRAARRIARGRHGLLRERKPRRGRRRRPPRRPPALPRPGDVGRRVVGVAVGLLGFPVEAVERREVCLARRDRRRVVVAAPRGWRHCRRRCWAVMSLGLAAGDGGGRHEFGGCPRAGPRQRPGSPVLAAEVLAPVVLARRGPAAAAARAAARGVAAARRRKCRIVGVAGLAARRA